MPVLLEVFPFSLSFKPLFLFFPIVQLTHTFALDCSFASSILYSMNAFMSAFETFHPTLIFFSLYSSFFLTLYFSFFFSNFVSSFSLFLTCCLSLFLFSGLISLSSFFCLSPFIWIFKLLFSFSLVHFLYYLVGCNCRICWLHLFSPDIFWLTLSLSSIVLVMSFSSLFIYFIVFFPTCILLLFIQFYILSNFPFLVLLIFSWTFFFFSFIIHKKNLLVKYLVPSVFTHF